MLTSRGRRSAGKLPWWWRMDSRQAIVVSAIRTTVTVGKLRRGTLSVNGKIA
jgi:hypothetical protein